MNAVVLNGSAILDAISKTSVAANFNKVLSEVIGLLPVVILAAIGFIAVRKGLSFLFQSLNNA